jgi:hypothetical protein
MLLDHGAVVSINCGIECSVSGMAVTVKGNELQLPGPMDIFRQLRLVRSSDEITIQFDGVHLGRVPGTPQQGLEIAVRNGQLHLDMVRWTAI